MRVLKGILIGLAIVILIVGVLFGLSCLFKALEWLPTVTDWLNVNIFEKLGIDFFAKL